MSGRSHASDQPHVNHLSHGPLPNWLSPIAWAASLAYGAAVRANNRRFERSRSRTRARVPVISVGNMTAGGTGKTPFVRWCWNELRKSGHHPAIALRGYRSKDGVSDEAEEYRALLPGVRVAVGADRVAALERALCENPIIDCAILDDGFQHRRLARDLDIVLIDASRPALDGGLLPSGWLREPPEGLRRADMVVVTRATGVDAGLAASIERWHGRPPAAWTRHAWSGLDVFECAPGAAPSLRREPIGWLAGRLVDVCVGIGNPAPFLHELRAAGAQIGGTELRRDHAMYDARDAARLASQAASTKSCLVVTGKDWVKLSTSLATAAERPAVCVAVPRVDIEFIAGDARVRAALRQAAAVIQG